MWIEPSLRLSLIVRWLDPDHANEFFALVFEVIKAMR